MSESSPVLLAQEKLNRNVPSTGDQFFVNLSLVNLESSVTALGVRCESNVGEEEGVGFDCKKCCGRV